jgi:hypothetical protein
MRAWPSIADCLALLAGPSLAEDGLPEKVRQLLPPGEDACYLARFEAKSMKPGQTLSEFYLFHLYDPAPTKEAVGFSRDEAIAFEAKNNYSEGLADVIARFTDKPFLYSQSVVCSVYEDSDAVTCGVECDGGSVKVRQSGKTVEIGFPEDYSGLSLNQSCGEPDDETSGRWLSGKDAGGSLRLETGTAAECLAIREAAHPGFVKDPVPLRERVAKSGWRCLKRSYDKAHMAKHPQQKVTAMAVALHGPVTVEKNGQDYPQTRLDVTLSFRLRDGKVYRRDATCLADEYQFRCEDGFRLRRRDGTSAWLLAGGYDDPDVKQPSVIDTTLGSDDKLFRLDAGKDETCTAD